jgi:hypothetical protein
VTFVEAHPAITAKAKRIGALWLQDFIAKLLLWLAEPFARLRRYRYGIIQLFGVCCIFCSA